MNLKILLNLQHSYCQIVGVSNIFATNQSVVYGKKKKNVVEKKYSYSNTMKETIHLVLIKNQYSWL